MIKLSDEQLNALNKIKEFINSDNFAISLCGAGGSGKSLLISYIIDYLENNDIQYCLCAPTHKAKTVIEYYTKRSAITLHKLLALSPKLDIFKLDFNDLQFKSGPIKEIPKNGIVICDESSMINDDLFNILKERCQNFKSKILFVSDSKQLAPVKSQNLSKVYTLKNQITLTKIFRQSENNAILNTLETLREHEINHFDTCIGEDGSLYTEENFKEFFKKCKDGIYKSIKNEDIFEAKVTAYTNARINKYNEFLTNIIFGNKTEYNKLEILMGNENIEFNGINYYNSMDYIIKNVKEIDINIPYFQKLFGYRLELYDKGSNETGIIKIISNKLDEDDYISLSYLIESLRLEALEAKTNYRKSLAWKKYFKVMNSFTSPRDLIFDNRIIRSKSFVRGYAVTVHKLQGSTLNNIYIDMKDINKCKDDETRRQLQYVSLSRAKHNVYIYQ